MIGQYSRYLEDSNCFYVLNPNRPFSDKSANLKNSMEWILKAGRIPRDRVKIISNPCLGDQTTVETVLKGHSDLTELLKELGLTPSLLTVEEPLMKEVEQKVACPVYPIRLYVKQLYYT